MLRVWNLDAGIRLEDPRLEELPLARVNLRVIMRSAHYKYFSTIEKNRLGDNAARSASTTVSVDGSGGSGFGLESVGGCGEESSEEIH